MLVAMYLRKSRGEEQESVEDTLSRHKSTLMAFAKAHGHVVESIYEEVVSGESVYNRPQMQALLADVQAERFDGVLCMDIDRLGRGGMRDQGLILDTFRLSGTVIITPDKTYDLSDDIDEELTEFRAFFARQEYRSIKKRLQRGLQKSIEEGSYVGPPPYGYVRAHAGKQPTLAVVEEEAQVVRQMFRWYLQGEGTSAIAQRLNQMGSHPHRGDCWSRSSVARILHNPAYTGKVVWNRTHLQRKGAGGSHKVRYLPPQEWTVAQGIHPAIVSQEDFDRVQALFQARRVPSKRVADDLKNPLAGLVRCGRCGGLMQRQAPKHKRVYLLCQRPGCVASAQFDRVEEAVLTTVSELLRSIPAEPPQPEDLSFYQAAGRDLRQQLARVDGQRERLHDLLEQGVYDTATYQGRMASLTAKRETLAQQLEELEQEAAARRAAAPPEGMEQIKSALDVYHTADAETRNRLLKPIVDHILYDKTKKTAPEDFSLLVTLRL